MVESAAILCGHGSSYRRAWCLVQEHGCKTPSKTVFVVLPHFGHATPGMFRGSDAARAARWMARLTAEPFALLLM